MPDNNGMISISQLRSDSANNNETGKNVDGKELRTFDNGLKEFDPIANGFEHEQPNLLPDDKTRALEHFDQQWEEREREMDHYNELLEQYGGEITEEELREEMGQEFLTEALQDGSGGKFEEEDKTVGAKPGPVEVDSTVTREENENAELERELMEDDYDSYDSTHSTAGSPITIKDPNLTIRNPAPAREPEPAPEPPVQVAEPEPQVEYYEEPDPVVPSQIHEEVYGRKEEPKADPTMEVKTLELDPSTSEEDLSKEDRDLAALEDEDPNRPPVDDFDKKLRAELEKKFKPITKKYDLAHAVVVNKPVTVSNALAKTEAPDRRIFTWALFNSKAPVTIKGFTAVELNRLASYMDDSNPRRRPNPRAALNMLWDHIIGDKGASFEYWAKCTRYADLDHLWFGVYGACFNGSNYIPLSCTECKELTIADNVPLIDMVNFEKEEYKELLDDILQRPNESIDYSVVEYRVQVTDDLVVGLREPSVYDMVLVPAMLDNGFRRDYEDTLNIIPYITNIYRIIEEDGQLQLRPIAVKTFPNNEVKTAKAKVIQLSKVLRYMDSDHHNLVTKYIAQVNRDNTVQVSYKFPDSKCDHCGAHIDGEPMIASDAVFIRHRLAILGS